jgi:hypothetical protein
MLTFIEFKEAQRPKAKGPRDVIPLGIVTDISELQ